MSISNCKKVNYIQPHEIKLRKTVVAFRGFLIRLLLKSQEILSTCKNNAKWLQHLQVRNKSNKACSSNILTSWFCTARLWTKSSNCAHLFRRFKSSHQSFHVWGQNFVVQLKQHAQDVSVDIFFAERHSHTNNWDGGIQQKNNNLYINSSDCVFVLFTPQ